MKVINIEEAKNLLQNYEYTYLQMMSEHILDRVSAVSSIEWDELIEAYFFNSDSQIHIFREDDEFIAVLTDDMEDCHTFDRKYSLAGKYQNQGKCVIIREYLKADEDGQSYVAATRLLGIE